MSDEYDITGGLDLLGDWLDAKGYTEEAGLCTRAMDFIHKQGEENEKLRARLEKAHSFISRADWMLFFEEEHAAATALKETGDE